MLERAEVGPEGTPGDEDVLVNVTVDAQGFAAADQSWIVASDWATFLAEFEALTERRQGKAALVGASPEDLRVEFFSTDQASIGQCPASPATVQRPTEACSLRAPSLASLTLASRS